jgi:ribosomal protein L37AE/L43A
MLPVLRGNFKKDKTTHFLIKDEKIVSGTEKGKPCPRCGSTNTDKINNIWYCYECQHEW